MTSISPPVRGGDGGDRHSLTLRSSHRRRFRGEFSLALLGEIRVTAFNAVAEKYFPVIEIGKVYLFQFFFAKTKN